jgi:type VI secretion system secreted protein VgrG
VRRGGAATSTVVGEPGTEIGLADHGQTRVMLRWDRRSTPDHSASEFARVMQPQMAGAIFNPRLGWEELLGFTDDGAEQPIVLGRLYNGAQRPPGSLPADKVETHFGTLTTPKGSQGNFLKINDSAGSEKLSIQASGDYNEQTENDKVVAIKVNHDRTIGGSRKLFVKERFVNNVDGAFTTNVGAFRKVTTDSNYSISAASENIVVAGARTFRVGGDYLTKTPHLMRLVVGKKGEAPIEHHSVFTKGMSTWLVKGGIDTKAALAESVSVAGAAITKVTGPMRVYAPKYQLSVKGIYAENFGHHRARGDGNVAESYRAAKLHMKGASSMDGGDVSIEAKAKLVIKASGVTVTMTPGSIEISGDFEGMTASMEDGNHKYG